MRLFDTHAHLLSERFDADREVLVSGLPSRGVVGCIEVGTDPEFSCKAQQLAERTDYIWAAVGVHPHDAADAPDDYIDGSTEIATRPEGGWQLARSGWTDHYDFFPEGCAAAGV